jgi:hypothetical protein
VPAAQISKQLEDEVAYAGALLDALEGVTVTLDSVCAFVINR